MSFLKNSNSKIKDALLNMYLRHSWYIPPYHYQTKEKKWIYTYSVIDVVVNFWKTL